MKKRAVIIILVTCAYLLSMGRVIFFISPAAQTQGFMKVPTSQVKVSTNVPTNQVQGLSNKSYNKTRVLAVAVTSGSRNGLYNGLVSLNSHDYDYLVCYVQQEKWKQKYYVFQGPVLASSTPHDVEFVILEVRPGNYVVTCKADSNGSFAVAKFTVGVPDSTSQATQAAFKEIYYPVDVLVTVYQSGNSCSYLSQATFTVYNNGRAALDLLTPTNEARDKCKSFSNMKGWMINGANDIDHGTAIFYFCQYEAYQADGMIVYTSGEPSGEVTCSQNGQVVVKVAMP